jgi:hypothetical protein
MAMVTLARAGWDNHSGMELYGRLLYAAQTGAVVDPAVQTEFGLADLPTRLAGLAANVKLACLVGVASVVSDCAAMHNVWHPDVTGSPATWWFLW